jgi:hypothetical protein
VQMARRFRVTEGEDHSGGQPGVPVCHLAAWYTAADPHSATEGSGLAGARTSIRGGVIRPSPVCKSGIAEASADCHHSPTLYVAHERCLTQSLYDRVVVHQHKHFVAVDLRNSLAQKPRQIEAFVLPVARQILPSFLDRAILPDQSWAANADKRRELHTATDCEFSDTAGTQTAANDDPLCPPPLPGPQQTP